MSTVTSVVNQRLNVAINNNILNIDLTNDTVVLPTDPGIGVTDNLGTTVATRTLNVTFESIYKNLAAIPFHLDMSDKKHLVKTHTLEPGKTIVVVTDILDTGIIVTSISGETGYTGKILRKITDMSIQGSISTTYDILDI